MLITGFVHLLSVKMTRVVRDLSVKLKLKHTLLLYCVEVNCTVTLDNIHRSY